MIPADRYVNGMLEKYLFQFKADLLKRNLFHAPAFLPH